MEAAIKQIEEESKIDFAAALASAGEKATEVASAAADKAEVVAGVAKEKASAVAVVAREKGGAAAKAAMTGIRKGFGGLSSRLTKRRKAAESGVDAEDAASQLRIYKELLDEGLITQEDYDAKKQELLGL